MKALTIHSPWANTIALGEKTIEVRSWRTRYRGPLLICASNRKPVPIDGVIAPYGIALATVDLVDCRPIRRDDFDAAWLHPDAWPYVSKSWAWVLQNPMEIEPFPVKGYQGLFNIDCEPRPLPPEYYDHFAWWEAHGASLSRIRQESGYTV